MPAGHPPGATEGGAVCPVGATPVGDVHLRAGSRGELTGAREVIGVDVGLGDAHDRHPVLRGEVEVDVDIAGGIDHEREAFRLAADEVAGLGEVLVVDAFEQHGRFHS